jgi:histidyl-tRNA synthetase
VSEDSPLERPVHLITGTTDQLPNTLAQMDALQQSLLDRFARAGYQRLRTPILEPIELHERTSGARIVSKLFRLADSHGDRPCLRPEWTASIVRAYSSQQPTPPSPWRVSYAGPVFRQLAQGLVEFTQVGVELLGATLPAADGEVIWLASWAASEVGVRDIRIRIGHIGVIIEMLRHSGLPEAVHLPLVERLSQAASADAPASAEDRAVAALERWLQELSKYLDSSSTGDPPSIGAETGSLGVEELFSAGRRTGRNVLERRARKWDLGHSLSDALKRFRSKIHLLADLRGPASTVLESLSSDFADMAPDSVDKLSRLVRTLGDYGIPPERIELDLGFGRGIGFYSQMVFELLAPVPQGPPIAVCGGGRYDGLALAFGSRGEGRGVGFSFGLERLFEALTAQGRALAAPAVDGELVLAIGEEAIPEAVRWANQIRIQGGRAVLETGRSLDDAQHYAQQLGLSRIVTFDGSPGGAKTYSLGPGR